MKLTHYPVPCILSIVYEEKPRCFSILSKGARLAKSFLIPAPSNTTVSSWSPRVGLQFITIPGPNLLWRTRSPTFSVRASIGRAEGWNFWVKSEQATGAGLSAHNPLGLIRSGEISLRKRDGGFAGLPPNRLRR